MKASDLKKLLNQDVSTTEKVKSVTIDDRNKEHPTRSVRHTDVVIVYGTSNDIVKLYFQDNQLYSIDGYVNVYRLKTMKELVEMMLEQQ